jgi:hypothetical protein
MIMNSSFMERLEMKNLSSRDAAMLHVRVIELFRHIQAGRKPNEGTWVEFQLKQGGYDTIESTLQQDDLLLGYVKDKIR